MSAPGFRINLIDTNPLRPHESFSDEENLYRRTLPHALKRVAEVVNLHSNKPLMQLLALAYIQGAADTAEVVARRELAPPTPEDPA